ncbi:hypothetical protein MesoLj113c_05730 [Mesorhizobium sp. 113-3-9]|uniref:YaaC family protein n=1 Tax=Mesorhizobium sp. 113-3-9 TaxID=2744517 RepID=UPI001927A1AF|nr:YaaC family protein [Mesorhizobium sp. 113-3-9]BCG84463.1 hypothetical protein MesoLj113c_05730 [Mesorhizobium sp. 113-3-9]
MDTGWRGRLELLKRDAENKILEPLRRHGWRVSIELEVEHGEHLVMSAERGGHRRKFALLYSSATDNTTYKALQAQVDLIMTNGAFYKLESYAHGITTPIRMVDEFYAVLVEWNRETSDGKFAPGADADKIIDEEDDSDQQYRLLLSEAPIEAVWLRLRQLHSVRLARKLIVDRATREGATLGADQISCKAEGLAFTLRNATDYYTAPQTKNVSQRILNLYYGTMAFAFAELVSAPSGSSTLAEIEEVTKQGHGLYTFDGRTLDLPDIGVGAIRSGFLPYWLRFMGKDVNWLPTAKAKSLAAAEALPAQSWVTLENLLARIPEIADLYVDIFESPTLWLHPSHNAMANGNPLSFRAPVRATRTYIILADVSRRMTKEDVAAFPGPISEIRRVASKGQRCFQAAVDHEGLSSFWEALAIHRSPLGRTAFIKPLFRDVNEYRAICFVLLYALSIIVRYRPSVWRRVQEGDLDHMRALIEAFLTVVERVLPEQFLASVTGSRIYAKQPGSFF